MIKLPASYALIPLFAALAFENVYKLLCAVPEEKIARFGKPIVYIGKNTYPIYLAHFLTAWYIPAVIAKYFDVHWVLLWAIALAGCALLMLASAKINGIFSKLTKKIMGVIKV